MKILYFIGPLVRGGAELHLVNIVIKLKKKGITPIVFTLEKKEDLEYFLYKNNIKVLYSRLSINSNYLSGLKFVKLINLFLKNGIMMINIFKFVKL